MFELWETSSGFVLDFIATLLCVLGVTEIIVSHPFVYFAVQ